LKLTFGNSEKPVTNDKWKLQARADIPYAKDAIATRKNKELKKEKTLTSRYTRLLPAMRTKASELIVIYWIISIEYVK